MKKLFALVLISLFVVSCGKKETTGTTTLTELETTPITRIMIIDGETIFEKTGFLKIKICGFLWGLFPNGWVRITETSEKGVSKSFVRYGEYANVTIQEYKSIYEVPALPPRETGRWMPVPEGE